MISYSYPPMGNPGSLRVAKFAKYLPDLGWHPVVITSDGGYSRIQSGMQDHVDLPGVEVVHTFDFGGLKRAAVSVGGERIAGPKRSRFATALLFPDRDISWYPFAYRAAVKSIRDCKVDALYSTSPNITNHLVAKRLSQRFGLPWVADFRDPWTTSSHYTSRGLRQRLEQRMEGAILRQASCACVVSENMRETYARCYPHHESKFVLLRNGYDHADFVDFPPPEMSGPFVLAHTGIFDGGRRNPRALLEALAMLKQQGRVDAESFRFQVIGIPESEVVKQVEELGVADLVHFCGRLPYLQSLALMANAAALLLIETLPENMTTKFYEYLGAQRPILAMMPAHFELAQLIQSLGAGSLVDPNDPQAIAQWLDHEVREFRRRGPAAGVERNATMQFSRAEGARILGNLLDGMVLGVH